MKTLYVLALLTLLGGCPKEGVEWQTTAKEYELQGVELGTISIDTLDMEHTDERLAGSCEHFFLSLYGEGFNRAMLGHYAGSSRKVRFYADGPDLHIHLYEIADDNQPGVHTWAISWDKTNGYWKIYLDGQQIGVTGYIGTPDKAIAGGYHDPRRNSKTKWSNFKETQ